MPAFPAQGEYPAVPGNKPYSIADISGPTSYTRVTNGGSVSTAPSGGQQVLASAFGLRSIECVLGMDGTADGVYQVSAIPVNIIAGVISQYQVGQPFNALLLRWVVALTGGTGASEVTGTTDLHTWSVRIMVAGRT